MKFQVREGYVLDFFRKVDIGDEKTEMQRVLVYGGQVIDMTTEEAHDHAHKLEPKDKAAEALLASKVLPTSPASATGLSAEALALVQATAQAMVAQILANVQAPAPAPAG